MSRVREEALRHGTREGVRRGPAVTDVLLDTLLVRSLLVPALSTDIGRRIWWPSALARAGSDAGSGPT